MEILGPPRRPCTLPGPVLCGMNLGNGNMTYANGIALAAAVTLTVAIGALWLKVIIIEPNNLVPA